MSDSSAPPPDSPPRNAGPAGRPTQRRGAARADAVPLIETVRITAPDLKRKQVEEDTVFIMSINDGNTSAALERAAGIIHGSGKRPVSKIGYRSIA